MPAATASSGRQWNFCWMPSGSERRLSWLAIVLLMGSRVPVAAVWLVFLARGALRADTSAVPPVSALALFDAYLAQAALSTPDYRADLKAGGDPRQVPLGRLFADGPMVGPFTYRPKTYDELTPDQRSVLLHDPKFRSFLITSREQADPIGQDDTGKSYGSRSALPVPSSAAKAVEFSISPFEMLRDRPMYVIVPTP